eukprot:1141253-Prorocentrum_minimum.AAC.1
MPHAGSGLLRLGIGDLYHHHPHPPRCDDDVTPARRLEEGQAGGVIIMSHLVGSVPHTTTCVHRAVCGTYNIHHNACNIHPVPIASTFGSHSGHSAATATHDELRPTQPTPSLAVDYPPGGVDPMALLKPAALHANLLAETEPLRQQAVCSHINLQGQSMDGSPLTPPSARHRLQNLQAQGLRGLSEMDLDLFGDLSIK